MKTMQARRPLPLSASPADLASSSRRTLLQAGGALAVAFSTGFAQKAHAQLAGPPAPGSAVDAWLTLHADNTAAIAIGRTEFGQGTLTGMLQIAAEELGLTMAQVSAIPLQTAVTRDQGSQVSSSSIEDAAPNLRAAAAEARRHLLQLAALRLQAPVSNLRVAAGIVSVQGAPGRSVGYGDLLGDRRFEIAVSGKAPLKPVADYTLVGTRVPRVDIPAKMAGDYVFMPAERLPGMLHGRVVRPAGQGALGAGARIKAVDAGAVAGIPGVQVVRTGDFLGVVAADEWRAVKAARALQAAVQWDMPATLPGNAKLYERMRSAKTTDTTLVDAGDVDAALARSPHVVTAAFHSPYESHAPFGPNCAIADVRADGADIVCPTQNLYPTRDALAKALGMKPEQVRVRYAPGAGTFGHSCYDDVAQAAAILSRAVGKPVRVQFSRGDEFGWDNYGAAHVAEVRAAAGADGKLTAYEYSGWQHGWYPLETASELAGKLPVEKLWVSRAAIVNKVNAGSMYAVANRRLLNHDLSGLDGFLKSSYMRAPLDLSISFASEQVIDELAHAAAIDPVEFRRRNISDPRWAQVLDTAATTARWQPGVAGARNKPGGSTDTVVRGRGVALGTHFVSYGAAVADIEVNRRSGVIRVLRLVGVLDAGLVVNPASVEHQIEGMLTQATSRILHEEVRFNEAAVTSLDWASYPILRFENAPAITPVVISRPESPSTGAGEEVLAAAGAAIANAFFDATGVRLRVRPLTPERVLAALAAA